MCSSETSLNTSAPYAHTTNGSGEWLRLDAHSRRVGELAAKFAADFDASCLARLAGLLHDIGKSSESFQAYLQSCSKDSLSEDLLQPKYPVGHSIHGARYADERGLPILPMILYGHHSGLSDLLALRSRLYSLADSIEEDAGDHEAIVDISPEDLLKATIPDWASDELSLEVLTRMLFSSLVDADLLDTEAHFSRDGIINSINSVGFNSLWSMLRSKLSRLTAPVLESVLRSAESSNQIFSLDSRYGERRILAAAAFAIRRILEFGLRRVIFAVPGEGEIDDLACRLGEVFGGGSIAEHYRTFDQPTAMRESLSEMDVRRRLGSENWASQFILTTHEQLFESIFSNKPSRCRKLHNLARSVLVIEGIESVPAHVLPSASSILGELATHYGVTLLFSSPLKPSHCHTDRMAVFLAQAVPIADDLQSGGSLHEDVFPTPSSWTEASSMMLKHAQVLCIAANRREALAILDMLNDNATLHLSVLMCPEHRRRVITEIRRRLSRGAPCRVVCTEAFGNVLSSDFPMVLRVSGSIGLSQVDYRQCKPSSLLAAESRVPYSADTHKDFDSRGIDLLRKRLSFATVADLARFSDVPSQVVIARYGGAELTAMLDRIERNGYAERQDWQELQRYSVVLSRTQFYECSRRGLVQEVIGGISVWTGCYTGISGMPDDLDDLTSSR